MNLDSNLERAASLDVTLVASPIIYSACACTANETIGALRDMHSSLIVENADPFSSMLGKNGAKLSS